MNVLAAILARLMLTLIDIVTLPFRLLLALPPGMRGSNTADKHATGAVAAVALAAV